MEIQNDIVKLNVGGRKYETMTTTLVSAWRNTFFEAISDVNWNLHYDGAIAEHIIDRNPDYFCILLNLIKIWELYIPPNMDLFICHQMKIKLSC